MNISKSYRVSRFVIDSGERCCLIVDGSSGLPLYYPNLYLTTQLRSSSLSSSTIMSRASHLSVLLKFIDSCNIDIEKKILSREFLFTYEVDALKDYSQYKRLTSKDSSNVSLLFDEEDLFEYVNLETLYARLTTFSYYLEWLSKELIVKLSQEDNERIEHMGDLIKARRPSRKKRNSFEISRSLSDEEISELWDVVLPDSDRNPFEELVKLRNYLIVLLLYHLGIRKGELLNIKVEDINFDNNTVFIARRADEKDDTRSIEPNAKTLDRLLPLGETLVRVLYDYIIKSRRKACKGRRHGFLIVTLKEGPTQGMPMSLASYQKIIKAIQSSSSKLSHITGHMLRHTWNNRFSEQRDQLPDAEKNMADEEHQRSRLMGWKLDSGTGARYTRRFTERKANKAALKLQEHNGTRRPRNLSDGD